MERVHNLFANTDPPFKAFLDRAGIPHAFEVNFAGEWISVRIPESDSKWPELASYVSANGIFDRLDLAFTRKEIESAQWCMLRVTSHFGYPQPEDTYSETTYEPGSRCSKCGRGQVQVAPFRFRKIPTQRHSESLESTG
jgi:hypothetical protein